MAKQKCGTCRFFQEAGLAGSGWCHHPQRKTPGVMIMVRRNELACRDEWSRSLWEAASGQASGELPAFEDRAGASVQPATSAESLHALLRDQHPTATSAAASGEDVLLSEARIISDVNERWAQPEPAPHPTPSGNFDPRTAIFRAREAYRDRTRASAAAARKLAGAAAIDLAPAIGRDFALLPASKEFEAGVPMREEPIHSAERAANEKRSAESGAVSPFPGVKRPVEVNAGKVESQINIAAIPDEAAGIQLPPRSQQTGVSGHDSQDVEQLAPSAQAERTPTSPSSQAGSCADDNLPVWFRVDLPRICRACRDYRPSVDGQRGWCANAWAFTHRRLVQGDDVAPCHSAIGDWWAPVDDVWLVAADVSAHGRSTPLLDHLIAEERAQRRRS